jgi:hypothetical protein
VPESHGRQWLVLGRDVSDCVHVDGQPTVAAAFIMDAEQGLILGSGVGPVVADAVREALGSAWHSAPPVRERTQIWCRVELASEVKQQLAALAVNAELVIGDPGAEAEDVLDSLVGHLAGRRQPRDLPTPADWSMLFRQTRAFVEAQPWRRMSDQDLVRLELRVGTSATQRLAVVLGNAEITFGFAVYPSHTLPGTVMAGGIPPAGTLCLMLDPRTVLPSYAADKARRYDWPEAMDMWPMFVAWTEDGPGDLSTEQSALLTLALAAALSHDREQRPPEHEGEMILAGGQRGWYRVRTDTDRDGADSTDTAQPTINRVVQEFLAESRTRLAPRTVQTYRSVLELLCTCLNSYGSQALSDDEQRAWEEAYGAGDERAFCRMFGPDKLVAGLAEFLGDFMIRKVTAGEGLLRASGTVTGKLATWLAAHGYLTPGDARDAVQRARAAARDLPRAARLATVLFEAAEAAPGVNIDRLADEDYVEDELMITGVEPGKLWFADDFGPVDVPRAATDLARTGWMVSIALARVRGTWRLVQVGNVYP